MLKMEVVKVVEMLEARSETYTGWWTFKINAVNLMREINIVVKLTLYIEKCRSS